MKPKENIDSHSYRCLAKKERKLLKRSTRRNYQPAFLNIRCSIKAEHLVSRPLRCLLSNSFGKRQQIDCKQMLKITSFEARIYCPKLSQKDTIFHTYVTLRHSNRAIYSRSQERLLRKNPMSKLIVARVKEKNALTLHSIKHQETPLKKDPMKNSSYSAVKRKTLDLFSSRIP